MMQFSKVPDDAYEEAANQIIYCKLFPLLLKDFVTRRDAEQLMLPSNLPVNTQVTVIPGQGVQVAFPAGTGSTATPGQGKGTGTVSPPFNASVPHPNNQALSTEKELIKNGGGRTVKTILDKALGG